MRVPFVVALAFVAAFAVACGSPPRSASDPVPPPTVAAGATPATLSEVYARIDAAIRSTGHVLHVTAHTQTMDAEDQSYDIELWLDADGSRARRMITYRQGDTNVTATDIISGDGDYRAESDSASAVGPLTCHENSSPVVSTLLGCLGYLEESRTVLAPADVFDGKPAIVLRTDGETSDEDTTSSFTSRLFVDPTIWLPVAVELQATQKNGGDGSTTTRTTRYTYEFIDAATLAGDFFDPTSIGYKAKDPGAALNQDLGITIYWLGAQFAGNGSLPPLKLRNSAGSREGISVGYRATLAYALASDRFGPPIVGFQEYPADVWQSLRDSGSLSLLDEAAVSDDIPLPVGHAVIYGEPEAGPRRPGRFLAVAYLGNTVILIDGFDSPSAYNSVEGFRAVVNALRPYP